MARLTGEATSRKEVVIEDVGQPMNPRARGYDELDAAQDMQQRRGVLALDRAADAGQNAGEILGVTSGVEERVKVRASYCVTGDLAAARTEEVRREAKRQ